MIIWIINTAGIYCLLISSLFFTFKKCLELLFPNHKTAMFKRFYIIELSSVILAIISIITMVSVTTNF